VNKETTMAEKVPAFAAADAPMTPSAPARVVAKQSGLTLIEMMIVLAILAVIMGILVGPRVLASWKKSQTQTAWLEAKEFEQAYTQWMSDNEGDCPEKIDDLVKYRNKKEINDPWAHPYVMKCGDQAPEDASAGFGVYSYGPNGKDDAGDGDDLASWKTAPKKKS